MNKTRKKGRRIALLATTIFLIVMSIIYAYLALPTWLATSLVRYLSENYDDINTHLFTFETEEELHTYLTNIITNQLNRSLFLKRVNVSFLDEEPDFNYHTVTFVNLSDLEKYGDIDISDIEAVEALGEEIWQHFVSQPIVVRTIDIDINGHSVAHTSSLYPTDWLKSFFD